MAQYFLKKNGWKPFGPRDLWDSMLIRAVLTSFKVIVAMRESLAISLREILNLKRVSRERERKKNLEMVPNCFYKTIKLTTPVAKVQENSVVSVLPTPNQFLSME